jgi:Leucine-rich repeat (LRR) protein
VSLNVSENEIETITEAIGKLKRLATLDLAGNRLSDLPDSLGKLHQLKSLDLSKNRLNKLPAAVLKLKRLESLFVGNNPINSLPDLCGFKKLAEVDITNTNLCPEEIEKLVGPDVEITKIPENFESDLPQLNRRCLWAMYKLWFMGNPDANPSEMPSFVKTMGDKWRPVGET